MFLLPASRKPQGLVSVDTRDRTGPQWTKWQAWKSVLGLPYFFRKGSELLPGMGHMNLPRVERRPLRAPPVVMSSNCTNFFLFF